MFENNISELSKEWKKKVPIILFAATECDCTGGVSGERDCSYISRVHKNGRLV